MLRLALFGCGRIGKVHAESIAAHPQAELIWVALCHITNSRHCAFGYDQRIEAFGERGMLTAENVRPTSVRFSGADETEAADPYLNSFLDRYTTAYRAELDHFLTAIETGTEPRPGFADGRAALALAKAASESAHTGRAMPVGKAPR